MYFFKSLLISMGFPATMSGDILFLLTFVLISVVFGMLIGRFRLVNVLINIYIAIAILTVIPSEIMSVHSAASFVLFALIVLALTVVDSHLFDIHFSGSGTSFFWRLFLMSFFEMGLIFSVLLSLWPESVVLTHISSKVYICFASQVARIFWMITPLIFLFFINRNRK